MNKNTIFLSLFILNLLSCKTEQKNEFNENKFIKNLKIERIETIQFPSKFGKIDYKDSFVTNISTYDTNGFVINVKIFNKEDYMKKYNSEEKYYYTNNYNNSKIENFNYKNILDRIYIDSTFNKKQIERKIYSHNQTLINLIKCKYEGENLVEYIVYDSTGQIESKNVNSYTNNKIIKSISYDEFDHIKNKIISEYSGNSITTMSFDEDDKLQYKRQSTIQGDLTLNSQISYISGNDTTNYKTEYSYQDSIFYKTNKHYKNNELDYVEVYKIFKRK